MLLLPSTKNANFAAGCASQSRFCASVIGVFRKGTRIAMLIYMPKRAFGVLPKALFDIVPFLYCIKDGCNLLCAYGLLCSGAVFSGTAAGFSAGHRWHRPYLLSAKD